MTAPTPAALQGKTVAVLGYGIQGRAQALNLRDSGVSVVVGLRPGGESWAQALLDRMTVRPLAEAAAEADLVLMLVPDEVQPSVYEAVVPRLRPGAWLGFAHGFNVRYGAIQPRRDLDVALVAPKAPGAAVRDAFVRGSGVPALVAVHQDRSGRARDLALAVAQGIGAARVGVIETTFAEETETDLFGEQTVLCGGVSELIRAGFQTLVQAGYRPEVAYFEVLHELKLIVDLVQRGGLEHMWANVSNTAEYGGRTRGTRVLGRGVGNRMKALLEEIQDGTFAKEWIEEWKRGAPRLTRARAEGASHELERVGARMRTLALGGTT